LVAMFSRNPQVFEEQFQEDCDLTWIRGILERLFEFLSATGTVPTRTTSTEKLFKTCTKWHDLLSDFSLPTHLVPAIKLAVGPYEKVLRWTYMDATIAFLSTVGELHLESLRMHHCVGSYADRAVSGVCYVFHGSFGGEPITILFRLTGEDSVHVISGVCNRAPSKTAAATIRIWLSDMANALKSQKDGLERKTEGCFGPLVAPSSE
jgi:hypothetical protein